MRTLYMVLVLASLAAAVAAVAREDIEAERILAARFHFTPGELAQVRQGLPVVKGTVDDDELSVIGAVRLPGKKERLADWVRNIEHFRASAELGVAHIVALPPGPQAFAGADPAVRQPLLDYTTAYLKSGNAGVSRDLSPLIAKAKTLTDLAPTLVAYLERYPAPAPAGVDERFYWSAMPVGSETIVSVHHLIEYRPSRDEIWIADKNIHATRYFDAAVLVVGLYDAPGGQGFYAVAGSRAKSSQLRGTAATVLRRRIQRTAVDTVKMYLEWIRDSLSAA